jgi:hypothetical protein
MPMLETWIRKQRQALQNSSSQLAKEAKIAKSLSRHGGEKYQCCEMEMKNTRSSEMKVYNLQPLYVQYQHDEEQVEALK